MASALSTELMNEARERADEIASATFRQKDKAARKCPKCGNVYCSRVGIDNANGIFPDPNIAIYCNNCWTIFDTTEVGFE